MTELVLASAGGGFALKVRAKRSKPLSRLLAEFARRRGCDARTLRLARPDGAAAAFATAGDAADAGVTLLSVLGEPPRDADLFAALEAVRVAERERALADGCGDAAGAARIEMALARAVARRAGAADPATAASAENWYAGLRDAVMALGADGDQLFRTYVAEPLTRVVAFGVPGDERRIRVVPRRASGNESNPSRRGRGTRPPQIGLRSALVEETRTGEAALALCQKCAPLVEVGAGTGYWAAVLRARGVDVEAFDRHPPTAALENEFFSRTFTRVERCGPAGPDWAGRARRTLLLVWPVSDGDAWDAACLAAYRAAGGRRVIYVGERRTTATASAAFLRRLHRDWACVEEARVPNWPPATDDCTVWVAK